MNKEYKRSLEDEIDWKLIDQLHSATATFSSTSLELKKLFFVLLGIAIPVLIKLAADKLDLSLFLSLYILIFTFWYLDSFTYYYQEKLRDKMDRIFNQIKYRNSEQTIITANSESKKQEFTIESSRTSKYRLFRSVFNVSVRLYPFLFILNSIGLILFLKGII